VRATNGRNEKHFVIAAPEKSEVHTLCHCCSRRKAVHRMCHCCSNELQIRAMHHIALSGYSDTANHHPQVFKQFSALN